MRHYFGRNVDIFIHLSQIRPMIKIADNLKYLRKKRKISQQELSETFGIARTTLGDYERGKTEPNLDMLVKFAQFYEVKIDDLIQTNLSHRELEIIKNRDLRVLAISVDKDEREQVELVETKAEAGYLESFSDPEYIKDLPKISFPNMPSGTFRGFEIHGDSMLPMESGSIVIASYVERLDEVKEGRTYIVVSKDDGLVYKRVRKQEDKNALILVSDNEQYLPYEIDYDNIAELWQYYAHLSFSDSKATFNYLLEEKLTDIQRKVSEIRDAVT